MVSVKARSRVSFWQHSSCKTAQRLSLQHPGRCLLTALVLTAILLILLVSYMRLSDEGAIPSLEMISLDTALQQRKAAEWHAVDGLQQQQQSQNTFRALSSYPDERKAARAYVKSFKKLGRPLIFLHIPKTAGTAIEFAAGKKRIAWGSCLFNHKPKRDICRYPAGAEWPPHVGWWHVPAQLFPLSNANPYQNAELFGVIRDPYDRMVSEFYYICTLKVFDWRPDQCDRSKLSDPNYMNEWLTRKLNDREQDSGLAFLIDNGHFTPQYDFIFGPNEVRMVDHVLTMNEETLADDFHTLMKAFDLTKVQLQKLNALGAAARGNSDTHLDVNHLDATALRSINEMYRNDFSLGDYAMRE